MATKLARLKIYIVGRPSYSPTDFNQVVLLDYVTNRKIYILTFTRLMATKHGRGLTTERKFSMQTCLSRHRLPVCLFTEKNSQRETKTSESCSDITVSFLI